MTTAETLTKLGEAIGQLHAAGLDSRYDDLLLRRDADETDARQLDAFPSYDYRAQTWRDGSDHAHMVSNDASAPFLFCGADVVSCIGFAL